MNLFVTYDEIRNAKCKMQDGAGRRKMEEFRGSIKEAREEKTEGRKKKRLCLVCSIFTTMDQSAVLSSSEVPLADTLLSNGMCPHFPTQGSYG